MDYSVQYYDIVLGGIITSVAIGAVIGVFTAVEPVISVVGTSALAIALIVHALFVRGPVETVADLSKEVEQLGPIELAD
jgi:hypothetical protein